MKMKMLSFTGAALCSAALLSAVANIYGTSALHPHRFGVINIMPNDSSSDYTQDSEPSLGVGLNAKYGKMAVNAGLVYSHIYGSANSGDAPWTTQWGLYHYATSMDWTAGGTA